jgi:hypothetical protein
MRRARDPISELRRAIDRLPVATREAMLSGIRANPIIVGAYTDNRGGICPMLAAHRNGGRTTLLAFARSWDRFAGASRVRRATRRELAVLERLLVQSLAAHADATDLGAAIAEHEQLKRRREQAPAVPESEIRAARLSPGGVGRLRPRRSDAERALARLDHHVLAATRD